MVIWDWLRMYLGVASTIYESDLVSGSEGREQMNLASGFQRFTVVQTTECLTDKSGD